MLSRVAERVYWLGRYVERTESTARLINVNSNLLLDLPRGTKIGWSTLIDILGCNKEFEEKKVGAEETNIIRFLLSDAQSPASILTALKLLRENARTTREIIPAEAWELINDSYLFTKENASKSISRVSRNRFLKQIIGSMQQLTGLLAGTMSHTSAYDFISLGRNLERADMSSRIIDVGSFNLIESTAKGTPKTSDKEGSPFYNILWMSVLQSLSGYQMYRQHVHDRINAEDVVEFTLQDDHFPRSASHCLNQLVACLNKLPNAETPLRSVASAQRRLNGARLPEILADNELHEFIDTVQLDIATIHQNIAATWFLPEVAKEVAKSA